MSISEDDFKRIGRLINDGVVEALENVMVPQLEALESRLDKRIDGLEAKVDNLEIKVEHLETRVGGIEDRMDKLEEKMDTMNGRLAENLMNHEERITEIERKAKFVAVA